MPTQLRARPVTQGEWSPDLIYKHQLDVGVVLMSLKPPDATEHAAVWFAVRRGRARWEGVVPLWWLLDAVEVWRLPQLLDVPTRAVSDACAALTPRLIADALNDEDSGLGAAALP